MNNFVDNIQFPPMKVPADKYCVRDNICYGRRRVGIYTDKMYYAVEACGEVVSPWFEELIICPSFNVCKKKDVYFLTSPYGNEIISAPYRAIGTFRAVHGLGRTFAKVRTLDRKYGTISSEGKVGIACTQDTLELFGAACAVCGKMSEDGMRYGIFAVNGEKIVDYKFASYKISKCKLIMIMSSGECWKYSKLGIRLKA